MNESGRHRARIWLLALGLSGMLVGAASGAIPDSAGVIHGCFDVKGNLSVVDSDAGQVCEKHATALNWNIKGEKGDPGPAGAAGPPGTGIKAVILVAIAPDDQPQAIYDPTTEELTLKIPRGRDGTNGLNGKDGTSVTSVTMTTLAPGSAATASFDPLTGVLQLGIPRGSDGANGKDGLGFSIVGNDYVLANPGGSINLVPSAAGAVNLNGNVRVNGGSLDVPNLSARQADIPILQVISLGTQALTAGTINTGVLVANQKQFRIDDPLDPKNKWLSHSTVESPGMTNLYDGIVTTDARGFAVVELPRYFEALNRDFKYQLTVVGRSFAQAIVWKEIADNHFTIRTSRRHVKVSWQVTGVRHDSYALAHPLQVESDKAPADRGRLSARG